MAASLSFRAQMILTFWICFFSFFAAASRVDPASHLSRRVDAPPAIASDSIPLTGTTFDLIVQKGTWIVKFYAPWCPHCKRLAPFWASLSIEFEKDGAKNDFHFGEVNCDIEEGLLKRFNVQGYPTILLFHNGKKVDEYEGATNSDKELRPYINDQLKKYKPVPVKDEPKAFDLSKLGQEKRNRLSVPLYSRTFKPVISVDWNFVKFTTNDCPFCAEVEPIWYQLAYENSDFHLAHVDCVVEQELCKSHVIQNSPTFKLFNNGEVAHAYPDNGKRTVKAFKEFVLSAIAAKPASDSKASSAAETWDSEPMDKTKTSMKFRDMTSTLGQANYTLATKEGIWFVLFENPTPDSTFKFTELHQRYGVRFATVDCETEKALCKETSNTASSSIQVLHLGAHADKYEKPKSHELVKTYVREKIYQLKASTRFPIHYFASQRLPNPDGKLMMLNNGVFDLLTNDGSWFVFFKSSRCLECRALESDWEKLAAQNKDGLNIAMVQCSTEQVLCERLNITTYPYLRFFKDGVGRDYNGPADMESLMSFASSASRPHIHAVTKVSFPNIHLREDSYFLYIYKDVKDLDALEPVIKGKYLLLDFYAISAKEYAESNTLPQALPYLQVFHSDVSTSAFSGDMSNPTLVQSWLGSVQYGNVTALDLMNFDLIMDQHEYVVLAVIDPIKDAKAVELLAASSLAYKPHGLKNKPLFASLDGIKWREYIERVYHKTSEDLPFVAIVDSKRNTFKLSSKDGVPLPFNGEALFQELDQPTVLPTPHRKAQTSLSPTTYMLLLFLCGLSFFLFLTYRQRMFKERVVENQDYNRLPSGE